MKAYYIDEFDCVENYLKFINYMLLYSDAFSLVYFKYKQNEKTRKSVCEVRDLLKPYKIYCNTVNQWPGTITLNENKHIYKFVLYRCDIGAEKALSKSEKLFDWDYPSLPMDLCFYKSGYACLVTSSHENFSCFYVEDEQVVCDLQKNGVNISFAKKVDKSELFLQPSIQGTQNTGDGSMCSEVQL